MRLPGYGTVFRTRSEQQSSRVLPSVLEEVGPPVLDLTFVHVLVFVLCLILSLLFYDSVSIFILFHLFVHVLFQTCFNISLYCFDIIWFIYPMLADRHYLYQNVYKARVFLFFSLRIISL